MRALVTGGAGFIGSHVVDLLIAAGHEVVVVDDFSSGKRDNLGDSQESGRLRVVECNIADRSARDVVAKANPEVVFHLAAQASVKVSVDQPALDAMSNVIGTVNVLEGAREAKTSKVVYAASGGTLYGELDADQLPAREDFERKPLSPYGVSKAAVIDYLATYAHLYDISFTALALANIYGPRQDPHGEAGVVSIFTSLLKSGKPCTIFGDGEQTRDYVYVADVAQAFISAAGDKATNQVCNIGTGVETSVNGLFVELSRVANVTSEAIHGPARAGDVRRSSLDGSKAQKELDWEPKSDLADGLAKTWSWFNR